MRLLLLIFFALLALLDSTFLQSKSYARMLIIEASRRVEDTFNQVCSKKISSSCCSTSFKRVRVKYLGKYTQFGETIGKFVNSLSKDLLLYSLSDTPKGSKCFVLDQKGFVFGKVVGRLNRTIKVIPYYSPTFASTVFVETIEMPAFAQSLGAGKFIVSFAEETVPKGKYAVYPTLYSGSEPYPFVLGYIQPGQRASINLHGVFASVSRFPREVSVVCR